MAERGLSVDHVTSRNTTGLKLSHIGPTQARKLSLRRCQMPAYH